MKTKPKTLHHFFITIIFFLISPNPSSFHVVHSATFPDDTIALRAFKSSINPATIPVSSCLATWDFSASDPCSVPRVTHFTCGLTCSNNRVIQLTLDSQNYAGTLTPLISKLTGLTTLDLSENNFYGPIPSSLSSLPNLQNLILRVNSFSGQIPPSITNLKSLQTLDLSNNKLTNSIPKSLASVKTLIRLDFSYNKLTGALPMFPPNLNELALKSNLITGKITKSSFNFMNRLSVIELSDNLLTGALEPWFFNLPSLQQVNLANNSLTRVTVGAKPVSELIAVDLSYNKIEGFLPVEFAALRALEVSYNKFRGPIPWQYGGKGSALRRLYLDGNYLNGAPPAGVFSGEVSGSLGDNCLRRCPVYSELCVKSQKPVVVCQQAYGGKP